MAKKGTLKQWRKFNDLSKDDLAKRIGKCSKTIGNWEDGTTQPTANDIAKIEKELNINWADVLIVQKDLHKK